MAVQNDITIIGRVKLPIFQGELWIHDFTIVDADGVAVDLASGYTAKLIARSAPGAATKLIDLDQTAGLTLGYGKITATLTAAETLALDFAQAGFELQLTKTSGTEVTSVAWGTVELQASYIPT